MYDLDPPDPHEEAPRPGAKGATVESDRNCVRCSYNLRGLAITALCPECGYPVERSLQGPLLKYSSPEYLTSLHRGATLLIISAIGSVAVIVIAALIEIIGNMIAAGVFSGAPAISFGDDAAEAMADPGDDVAAAAGGAGGPLGRIVAQTAPGLAEFLRGIVDLAFSILTLAGWYLLSTEDPAFVGTENGSRSRRWVRILVIARLIAVLLGLIATGAQLIQPFSPQATVTAQLITDIVPGILWICIFFVGMHYITWIANRIPDHVLAYQSRRAYWLLPLIFVGLFCCFGIGPLIALILYVILIYNLRRGLGEVLEEIALADAEE